MQPGHCIVAKRIDFDDMTEIDHVRHDSGQARYYKYGYDFFAIHASDISKYKEQDMVFGAPWWDHHLPLVMASQGIQIHSFSKPLAYHLKHNERWNLDLWVRQGIKFVKDMKKRRRFNLGLNTNLDDYWSKLPNALRSNDNLKWHTYKRLRGLLLKAERRNNTIQMLHGVSNLNIKTIDGMIDQNQIHIDLI